MLNVESCIPQLKFESRKQDYSTDTKLVVEISIRDINDNPPQFQRDLYEISVKEEVAQGKCTFILAFFKSCLSFSTDKCVNIISPKAPT